MIRKRNMENQAKVTEKANKLIGIGPIYQQSIEHFYDILGDYTEAKIMAAKEYLTAQLRFSEDEMKNFDISDTQVSTGSENTLYIALSDRESVIDIRTRMADCQNPSLWAVDFIPPQYYERYMALSRIARDMRSRDNQLKTQVRFGPRDVELVTKRRGSDERYTIVPLGSIEMDDQLPKYDHSIKWRRRQDRPPRRRVSPSRGEAYIPSMRQDRRTDRITTPTGSTGSVSSGNSKARKFSKQDNQDTTNTGRAGSAERDLPAMGNGGEEIEIDELL